VALGGIAALAAVEYASASRGPDGQPVDLAAVGRPSEAVLEALRRVEAGGADAQPSDATSDPAAEPMEAPSPLPDPWADLPPSANPRSAAMLPEPDDEEGTGRA